VPALRAEVQPQARRCVKLRRNLFFFRFCGFAVSWIDASTALRPGAADLFLRFSAREEGRALRLEQ
jgi:hypothetical protein